jgi:hypothetical protein
VAGYPQHQPCFFLICCYEDQTATEGNKLLINSEKQINKIHDPLVSQAGEKDQIDSTDLTSW